MFCWYLHRWKRLGLFWFWKNRTPPQTLNSAVRWQKRWENFEIHLKKGTFGCDRNIGVSYQFHQSSTSSFAPVDSKSVKRYWQLDWNLMLLGATGIKEVACKYVDEIDPRYYSLGFGVGELIGICVPTLKAQISLT